ncbi:2,3-bisphosphoglycerate-independent phosphoglycerate mutase [Flavobacteriaceae bacterium]|jgi:2,3-bisphosphoglycerate-independent phosphoglycerate mutase|nr:2,3-bisphosphoglycerate-independent phosphoglycerate mutase [Flavobacteriaceae bacterium]
MAQKVILMILDGWGLAPNPEVSAVDLAQTPNMDTWFDKYPHASLLTHGENVGLPNGQMGNSEVGHMNLGAGRIVYQDLVKISKAIEDKSVEKNPVLVDALTYAQNQGKNLHFLGLLSDGGVHAHMDHLEGLLEMAAQFDVPQVFVHGFTDGRDVDPKSSVNYLRRLSQKLDQTKAKLASITGRYYAMDRDKRWERVKKAYDALVHAKGTPTHNMIDSIEVSYAAGVTDEFIEPLIAVDSNEQPLGKIAQGDVVIFFNYRTDRGRQLTDALSQRAFPEQEMIPLDLYYVTLTNYDKTFNNIKVVFEKDNLGDTLGETLSKADKTQIRIAETEKYPHVTFFFNCGREEPFKGEERIMCPSPKVATYDLQPEMSAFDVRDAIIPKISEEKPDFICLNFANPDMVGHTGDLQSAIKACETVDQCAGDIIDAAIENQYKIIIIADHGNCETMVNADGSPNTAHTLNPVPLILVDINNTPIIDGILGDIAPTILKLMAVEIPTAMTGKPLV